MWIMRAWERLDADRHYIGGEMGEARPRRITLSAVIEWCDLHEKTRAQTRYLDRMIARLEAVFLEWWHDPAVRSWRTGPSGKSE